MSEEEELTVTMEQELEEDHMLSGAVYREAGIGRGGSYDVTVQAAAGPKAVTSLLFWDGPEGVVGELTRLPQRRLGRGDENNCDCCFRNTTEVGHTAIK